MDNKTNSIKKGNKAESKTKPGKEQTKNSRMHDLIIIGSGPAGLTAAIYASRYMLDYIVIGKTFGGAISQAHKVCNFPTQNNISGFDITQKMTSHVFELGGDILQDEVKGIEIINIEGNKAEDKEDNNGQEVKTEREMEKTEKEISKDSKEENSKKKSAFIVKTESGTYRARKVILAAGRKRKKLDVPGEDRLLGKGVSYCATCDAPFFRNKTVAVVGGSNSALTAALLLAEHAEKVYIIYRQDRFFRAEPAWINQIKNNSKIEPIFNAVVKEIQGKENVERVVIADSPPVEKSGSKDYPKDAQQRVIKVDGIFVEVGFIPNSRFSDQLGLKTNNGYIKVDKGQRTSVGGVYAAGDMTDNVLKQVITACGEGAIAASSVYNDLKMEG